MIKINKKLKNQKMAETKSQKRTKKEITAKSDLTQSYSRSKKMRCSQTCNSKAHKLEKRTSNISPHRATR